MTQSKVSPTKSFQSSREDANYAAIAAIYGDAMGHIRAGHDIGGTLQMMKMVMMYTIHVMQAPALDLLPWKNPVLMWFNKHGLFDSHISVPFALKNQDARK